MADMGRQMMLHQLDNIITIDPEITVNQQTITTKYIHYS